MSRIERVLCYLNAEQTSKFSDLSQLKPYMKDPCTLQLVVNVYDPSLDSTKDFAEIYEDIYAHLLEDGKDKVDTLAGSLGPTCLAEAIWEHDGAEWLKDHEDKFDLIALYGKRDKADYSLPGSWKLVRQLSTPILVINPTQKKRKRHTILAAVDIKNTGQSQLNERVLDVAEAKAKTMGADLHIIAVMHMSQVVADLEFVDERKFSQKFKDKYADVLYRLAEAHGVPKERVHFEIGVPHKVIRQAGKEIDPHCIVMGTMGREGIANIVLGNTAERVLTEAPQSVLIVPAG